jgi:hypothetical protein
MQTEGKAAKTEGGHVCSTGELGIDPEGGDSSPEAWLFVCRKPGQMSVFSSIDSSGFEGWPWDQWLSVKRVPLVRGEGFDVLWPRDAKEHRASRPVPAQRE